MRHMDRPAVAFFMCRGSKKIRIKLEGKKKASSNGLFVARLRLLRQQIELCHGAVSKI